MIYLTKPSVKVVYLQFWFVIFGINSCMASHGCGQNVGRPIGLGHGEGHGLPYCLSYDLLVVKFCLIFCVFYYHNNFF